jgi:hypothetical protein
MSARCRPTSILRLSWKTRASTAGLELVELLEERYGKVASLRQSGTDPSAHLIRLSARATKVFVDQRVCANRQSFAPKNAAAAWCSAG